MKSILRLHPLLEDQELREAYLSCEQSMRAKPKGKCLMRNSGLTIADIVFTGELERADKRYYFDAALDWSDAHGKMMVDWIATIRGFARRDLKDGKLKMSNYKQSTVTAPTTEFIPRPISKTAKTYNEYLKSKT